MQSQRSSRNTHIDAAPRSVHAICSYLVPASLCRPSRTCRIRTVVLNLTIMKAKSSSMFNSQSTVLTCMSFHIIKLVMDASFVVVQCSPVRIELPALVTFEWPAFALRVSNPLVVEKVSAPFVLPFALITFVQLT